MLLSVDFGDPLLRFNMCLTLIPFRSPCVTSFMVCRTALRIPQAADTTTVFVVGAGSGAPRGASVPLGQPATQRQVPSGTTEG